MPRPASSFLPAVILYIQCHINKWKEKLCLEHGSFSLVPVSVVSEWQICFALVLWKDSSQCLSSFIKERLSCSLTWQCSVVCLPFTQLFSTPAFLTSLHLFMLFSFPNQATQFPYLAYAIATTSTPSCSQQSLGIFLLSLISDAKCTPRFKVASFCQFIYRTSIFHSLPSTSF